MSLVHRFATNLTAVFTAILVASCGQPDSTGITVAVIGEAKAPFEKGIRLSLAGQLTRASTEEGLVAFDEQGRIIPALADRWIVTDDGNSYIFRLRDGTWHDGRDLTGRSAQRALNSAIRALRGTSLGLDLAGIGEIREMAGRVVEIRLSQPMPHFLQLLAQPELGLSNRGKGAGPMTLEREDDVAVLSPIKPEDLGLPTIHEWESRARQIRLFALSGEAAVKRFNGGEADLVLGGSIDNFPHTSSVGILRGTIQLDPVAGLFGFRVAHTDGFLADAANREAIAMAIDREALITPFGLDGWLPSTRIVQPGLAGDLGTIGERWSEMTIEERRGLAAERVSRWRSAQESDKSVQLRIALPDGPGSDALFKRFSDNLGRIGIEIERVGVGKPADLRLIDEVARYPHASWFLNRLNCRTSRAPCDANADARAKEAMKAEGPAELAALLAEAEAELTVSNIFIPFGPPIRWSLVRGDVQGFHTNPWGWHPLMPMALIPN